MTTAELIKMLQAMDPEGELEVQFGYNYGDYAKTTVSQKIRTVEEANVVHSDYFRMDRVVDEDDDRHEDDDTNRTVLLLS